jgi:hypothetical protein
MPRLAARHARRAASHVLYILLLWHAIALDFTLKINRGKKEEAYWRIFLEIIEGSGWDGLNCSN